MENSTHEKKLIRLVSEGDERAFNELFALYYPSVYTAALKLLHTTMAAEEVVQDVFLDVWMQRHQLPSIQNFAAWLNTVSRNTIFTAFNRSLKQKFDPLAFLQENAINNPSENQLVEKDYRAILQEAIERLSPKQKETYRLVREVGLKRNEAAKILNVSPETVKFNLDEATRKVRAYCLARIKYLAVLLFCLY